MPAAREQYRDDRNLRVRQRLWNEQDPPFDLTGWVLGLVELPARSTVLDLGCGPGRYLRALRERGLSGIGLDLSVGIMPTGEHPYLVHGDAVRLPFADDTFDVVLAPHMLYHVSSVADAVREIRRVLRDDGACVAVTNGAGHTRALAELVERSVHETDPGWEMRTPASEVFSLENGAEQLRSAFESVSLVRPDNPPRVAVTDARIVADYVASVADGYETQVTKPWTEVVEDVYGAARERIDLDGVFVVEGDPGAFVCR